MAEKPILFNDEMIRAILDGRKTQTRRPMRQQPAGGVRFSMFTESGLEDGHGREVSSAFQPGDILWVRETWKPTRCGFDDSVSYVRYRADDTRLEIRHDIQGYITDHWRPSIHMLRWASRITLEVTDVRAERVQDMTQADAAAEGAGPWWNPSDVVHTPDDPSMYCWKKVPEDKRDYLRGFVILWDSIYAKRGLGWEQNPWVEAVTFVVREVRE
jgi:hypothetical protein